MSKGPKKFVKSVGGGSAVVSKHPMSKFYCQNAMPYQDTGTNKYNIRHIGRVPHSFESPSAVDDNKQLRFLTARALARTRGLTLKSIFRIFQ